MNKNLQNLHRIIRIREFFGGSALLIIEFSFELHGFRQNPCTSLCHFHFDSLLHWSLIRYCRYLCLVLSGIESLSNRHGIVPIRWLYIPPELFIIEFSIGVHRFRQNPCTLHHSTGKILKGSWSYLFRKHKSFRKAWDHTDPLIFSSSRPIQNRSQYWGKWILAESTYPIVIVIAGTAVIVCLKLTITYFSRVAYEPVSIRSSLLDILEDIRQVLCKSIVRTTFYRQPTINLANQVTFENPLLILRHTYKRVLTR